jgi:FAD/FMN-containing dehydrogenase
MNNDQNYNVKNFLNLQSNFEGDVLRPGEPSYDEARTIWNGMIDRKPAAIARCRTEQDVVRSVNFAREHQMLLSIRGGGHNIAGHAVCDGGLMIDLSGMKEVQVDARQRRARVGPGALLSDLDAATQAHGLATPLGINSTTGVAGLTLGGGFGWLTRKFGLTVDNLRSVRIVTADGRTLTANSQEHPDLYWAIRGGGGNFGVVTEFEFDLHPVGPQVLSGLVVYGLDEAGQVLRQYRAFAASAPDELSVWAILRHAPPLPFLPASVHGKLICVLAICFLGNEREGRRMLEPLARFGHVLGEHVGMQPFTAWQQAFDPLLTPGARNYWKSHNFATLEDGALELMVTYARKLPSPHCEIFLGQLGGKAARVPASATAYGNRDANFVMNVHGRWESSAEDEKCIAWAREFFQACSPFATGGAYINFLTADESTRVQQGFGPNYPRLAQMKKHYDPSNLFRMNQNIRPA